MRRTRCRSRGKLARAGRAVALAGLLGSGLGPPLPAQLADGVLDPTFGGVGVVTLPFDLGAMRSDLGTDVVPLPGDRLLLAGSITTGSLALPRNLAAGQLTWTGGLDTGFGGGDGRVHYPFGSSVWDLVAAAVTSQGEIVLAGSVHWSQTDADFLVVRLHADGSLDPTFGGGTGWVSIPFNVNPGGDLLDLASSLFLTGSDSIVVAGTVKRGADDWDFAVARLTATGAPHPTFGGGTGKVVIPIDAYGYAGTDQAFAVFPSADGAIVVAGTCESLTAGNFDFAIAEIDYGGSLVPAFGKVVIPFDLVYQGADWAYGGAVDDKGRILVAGSAEGEFGQTRAAVVCLTPAGALCPDFGSAGRVTFPLSASPKGDEKATGVAVDDLGRILLGGTAVPTAAGNRDVAVARLLPGGALDASFAGGSGIRVVDLNHGPGGDDDEALGLVLAAGKPVVVGATQYLDVDDDFFAVRIWVSLVQADGFERGTHEGWSHRIP
ncbi:MAG: delta-60 repeat domain-containing protein [Thermoanaerobaculia bacterium]|nr:delta-60 repeat domain-containing protein [Thermoanaerobaculia bacterium]